MTAEHEDSIKNGYTAWNDYLWALLGGGGRRKSCCVGGEARTLSQLRQELGPQVHSRISVVQDDSDDGTRIPWWVWDPSSLGPFSKSSNGTRFSPEDQTSPRVCEHVGRQWAAYNLENKHGRAHLPSSSHWAPTTLSRVLIFQNRFSKAQQGWIHFHGTHESQGCWKRRSTLPTDSDQSVRIPTRVSGSHTWESTCGQEEERGLGTWIKT